MDEQQHELLKGILDSYPPVESAFAYGSGVFKQPDLYMKDASEGPMVDLVFVVESELEWHSQVRMVKYQDDKRAWYCIHCFLLPVAHLLGHYPKPECA